MPEPEKVLALLGMGARGGLVVPGVDGTRALLQRAQCVLVVFARDASPRAVQKVKALATAQGVPVLEGTDADAIGARLGKPPVMVVGVKDRALAAGILAASTSRDRT